MMPPSSISTLVVTLRLLVVGLVVEVEVGTTLELSIEIFNITAVPSVDLGVTFRIVPTSSLWMVWKGLTAPPAVPVLVY